MARESFARWRRASVVLAVTLALSAAAADAGSTPRLAGRSLTAALRVLQDDGWPVVFSSRLVRDSMRVVEEPAGADRRTLLADLLRPHGLAVRDGARGRLVVVAGAPAPPRATGTTEGGTVSASVAIARTPALAEEIVVRPPLDSERSSPVSTTAVAPDDAIRSLPQLGADPFRAVAVLPGASSSGGSSRLSVRGSGDDEVLVLLDGLELVSPYHLADFESALSFVTPSTLERADLFTGGFPAQYGDRMSGVVDLTTRRPATQRKLSLGLDLVHVEGAAAGLALGERASWLVSARGGSYQFPLEFDGRDEHPRYWDSFAKLDLDVTPRHRLLVDRLVAQDEFELSSDHEQPSLVDYRSAWDNSYSWARHSAVFGSDLFAETVLGSGRITRERTGSSTVPATSFSAREQRDLDFEAVKQDWHWEPSSRVSVKWGIDLLRSDATVDFSSLGELGGLRSLLGEGGIGAGEVLRHFDAGHHAAYASTRLQLGSQLSLELGLRHDSIELTGEKHLSPRLSGAWQLGRRSVLRGAWGWFYQSTRPYELELEDGLAGGLESLSSERAEHHVLGFEHAFENGLGLRIEGYHRRLDDPRARFENLFDPDLIFPELATDRVRLAPESGTARGVELSLRSPRRGRLAWWMSYTASSITDEIGGREVPRSLDQPHDLRAGLGYRAGRSWDLDLVWQYHTGWPTTALFGRTIEGDGGSEVVVPVLGSLRAERLPDYHRLDLRVGRQWALGRGHLAVYLDLFNLYDRRNVRGFEDIRLERDPDGGVRVDSRAVTWTGFLPSIGLRWER